MLQKMRDNTQSLGFKILVGAIIFVLAVFGFGAFNLFVNPDPDVAEVNGEGISQNELAMETERSKQQLLAQLGESADPSMIDDMALSGRVLQQLVNRRLLEQTTEDLGLATSKQRSDRLIVENETFHVDGAFNDEYYIRVLRQYGYTAQAFSDASRTDMAIEQLQTGVTGTAIVPDWQLRWLVALMQQRRDLAYLSLTQAHFAARAEVTDEELQQYYDDNRLAFQTEETLDLEFVQLSWRDFLDGAKEDVLEEDVVARYEADREAAAADEQRRASHILLRVTDERDEAAAIAEAEQLTAQLNTGSEFATLAEAHSDDPGSAANGGDLGPAGRGVFVPEFEEALFQLEVGQLSEPVVTQFGVHIIRLEEIIQPTYPTLDEQRDRITTELAEQIAKDSFVEQERQLDSLAFERNDALEPIAEEFGIGVQTVSGVTRNEGPGLFSDAALREAAFSVDVLEQGFNSAAISTGDDEAIVIRLAERHIPREQSFDEVRDDIESSLRAEKASLAISEALSTGLERLEAGDATSDIAATYGLSWTTQTLATANEPNVPQPVLQAAFELPAPGSGDKGITSAELEDGYALVTVTRVENGDIERMTEQEVDGLARFLKNSTGNLDFSGLFETVRADASISGVQQPVEDEAG